jgi:CRISPR/Cas system-associated protein Cas5 (RAMP superfamily)
MKPPKQSPEPESNQELEFEEELLFLERSLVELKERYTQVQSDRILKAEYEKRRQELNQNKHYTPEIKAELKHIKQQLEVVEVSLESQLFSWKSVKKPFWQIIRFGGLGVIIGWILKSYVG